MSDNRYNETVHISTPIKAVMSELALERQRYAFLAALGCILCGAPACVHHLTGNAYRGLGKKAGWQFTIPLCPLHHQHGGYGVAIHAGVKEWEKRHGTQEELLERTNALLENNLKKDEKAY